MKRYIIILTVLFLPICSFSQEENLTKPITSTFISLNLGFSSYNDNIDGYFISGQVYMYKIVVNGIALGPMVKFDIDDSFDFNSNKYLVGGTGRIFFTKDPTLSKAFLIGGTGYFSDSFNKGLVFSGGIGFEIKNSVNYCFTLLYSDMTDVDFYESSIAVSFGLIFYN